mmetsp:Transcript_33340/g.68042  ORF Transcript_33340/g.68042 Transcript_33340/m.68042 type:complete len:321 (-) Transcript_33340:3246-4208(-)
MRMFFLGSLKLVERRDLRKASSLEAPKHATSPVLAISTPRTGSEPRRRVKENMGALTPTNRVGPSLFSRVGRFMWEVSCPIMPRVAASMKSTPMVLETKGKDREARTLHSMHMTSVPLATNWMFTGPVMLSLLTIFLAASLTRNLVYAERSWAGRTSVASPLWTPAFSMCSCIAAAMISPSLPTPSNSISLAPSMKSEMTTGCSAETSDASVSMARRWSSLYATFMAAPDRTYEGRTRTGYPTSAAKARASSAEVSSVQRGCCTPISSIMAENLFRSSALSIMAAGVPRSLTPALSRGRARALGICPPTETTTPSDLSRW